MRIDLHSHVSPPGFLDVWESQGAPGPTPRPGQQNTELLAAMDELAIDAAVVSGPPFASGGSADVARRLSRANNEGLAKLVRERPDRIGAIATLPLPDVDGALDEIAYALDVLELDGIRLQTSAEGVYASEPQSAPVLEELNRRGAYVLLHPSPPPQTLPHAFPPWAYEYPHETTRVVAGLLFSGALGRNQDLRLQLSHLGGTIPFLAGRLRAVPVREPQLVDDTSVDVRAELARLYYDTAQATDPGPLSMVAELAGIDHIVFGTDWPFDPLPTDGSDPVPGLDSLGRDRDLVESRNASALVPRLVSA